LIVCPRFVRGILPLSTAGPVRDRQASASLPGSARRCGLIGTGRMLLAARANHRVPVALSCSGQPTRFELDDCSGPTRLRHRAGHAAARRVAGGPGTLVSARGCQLPPGGARHLVVHQMRRTRRVSRCRRRRVAGGSQLARRGQSLWRLRNVHDPPECNARRTAVRGGWPVLSDHRSRRADRLAMRAPGNGILPGQFLRAVRPGRSCVGER
jgi:hypothetical protein